MGKLEENKELLSWSVSKDAYAIKVIDEEVAKKGLIIIPTKIESFFGVDAKENNVKIRLNYLNGDYESEIFLDDGKKTIKINKDLHSILMGIWHSLSRDEIKGRVYIAFIKKGNNKYDFKIGKEA